MEDTDNSAQVQLPTAFEECPIEQLAILLGRLKCFFDSVYENLIELLVFFNAADMFERLMAHNDQIPLTPESLTRFHSRSTPGISILDYLNRIVKFTNVEKTCLLITLYYIDQICARMPLFTISSLTCHRFIIASITVSSKGLCDAFCTNSLYAKVGGIPVPELNMLEREFLAAIDWRLTCTRELLQDYYVNLVRTNRTGEFVIIGPHLPSPTPPASPEATDMNTEPSAELSPQAPRHRSRQSVLMEPEPNIQQDIRPTIEQNMAFAALREQQAQSSSINPRMGDS